MWDGEVLTVRTSAFMCCGLVVSAVESGCKAQGSGQRGLPQYCNRVSCSLRPIFCSYADHFSNSRNSDSFVSFSNILLVVELSS